VETLPGAGFGQDPRIMAVRAKADASVSAASVTQNFGRSRVLFVDASPRMRTYVRFNADLSSYDITHVSLLLYSRTRSRTGYRIQLVYGRWREHKINWGNAPEVSPPFVASGPLRARKWKPVDVTSLVAGEERVSFALTTRSPNGLEFASRETGLRGPRLIVEREEETTTSTEEVTTG
jgi:hypothetical protein